MAGQVVSPVAGPEQSLFEAKVSVPQPRPGDVSRKKLIGTARSSERRVIRSLSARREGAVIHSDRQVGCRDG